MILKMGESQLTEYINKIQKYENKFILKPIYTFSIFSLFISFLYINLFGIKFNYIVFKLILSISKKLCSIFILSDYFKNIYLNIDFLDNINHLKSLNINDFLKNINRFKNTYNTLLEQLKNILKFIKDNNISINNDLLTKLETNITILENYIKNNEFNKINNEILNRLNDSFYKNILYKISLNKEIIKLFLKTYGKLSVLIFPLFIIFIILLTIMKYFHTKIFNDKSLFGNNLGIEYIEKNSYKNSIYLQYDNKEKYHYVKNIFKKTYINKELFNFCFYGDPGTGKTELAKNIASSINGGIVVNLSSLITVGKRSIDIFFKIIEYCKKNKYILIIDDAESSLISRNFLSKNITKDENDLHNLIFTIINMILSITSANIINIIFIMNDTQNIDFALYRRFKIINFENPNDKIRLKIFQNSLLKQHFSQNFIELIIKITNNFSHRDINNIIKYIKYNLNENIQISHTDVLQLIQNIKNTVNQKQKQKIFANLFF